MRHITDIIRGLAALLLVLAFMVGVPTGLSASVGWPLPTTIPSLDQIQLALRSGIDPELLINTLAVIVWITWAQLVIALTAEVVAAVRGRAARRLPVLPGLQPAVAQLVAAIILAAATLGPVRPIPAAAAPPTSVSVAPPPTTSQPGPEAPHLSSLAVAPHGRMVEADQPTYRVMRHDTLWRIAETTLGDGRRWKDIRDLNAGRTMPDGHRFSETTDRLPPGWLLALPTDAATPAASRPLPAGDEITVRSGDSFWTIAETTLEKAWGRTPSPSQTSDYWRRLVDANRDRLLPPHDPDLIYPGQRFETPAIPTDPEPEAVRHYSDRPESVPDKISVEPGDSLWSIAEAALADAWHRTPTTAETTDYWQDVVDANRETLPASQDPNLIHPGDILELPAIPDDPHAPGDPQADTQPDTDAGAPHLEPLPADPDESATDSDTFAVPPLTTPTLSVDQPTPTNPVKLPEASEPTAQPAATEPVDEADGSGFAGDLAPMASTAAGLGVLAAGLVALLRRLRATQIRQRRPGTIPTPPPPDTVGAEALIRTAAAPTSTEFLDLALRAIAREVTATHIPPPQVVGAHLTADTLRLLLWTPHHNPPPGWRVDDDGRSWTIPTGIDTDRLRDKARGVPAPYPALVTVGHGDRAQLLLDLEYLGATQITGDPADVAATCYTMATELAASPIADDIQIVCVGFGADLAQLERVHVVDDLTEILPTLEAKAQAITRLASPSPLQGRLSLPGGDTWNPIIVLDPSADAPEGARQLLTTAHSGRGAAAIVGYPTGDRWRLHIENDSVRIEPLGYTFARRNLTPPEQAAVADLVDAAKDPEGLPAELATDPLLQWEAIDDAPDPTHETKEPALLKADDGTVVDATAALIPEMKVLGTLRVDGLESRFKLRKCTELVAYLTFHPGGVEADTLMEALWPDQPPDYGRLQRHTYRTRTSLGLAPDGEPYLPYVDDGIYRISPHLRSDIQAFSHHVGQADRAAGGEQADHLRTAFELVEAAPFTGAGNAYTWAHTDGIITHTIVAIDNAAHRLAQHALMHDAPDEVTWAARKGLIATGACEECYRNLMRAAAAEDNQVALEAVYAELLAVVDADEGPDATDILEPATIELYEQHSRKNRRRVG